MNHYERLKVTQDAPVQVIRASYRALARMLHPDGQGGSGGRDDHTHDQMAALNGAYQVLANPDSRQEYDAALLARALDIDAPPVGAQAQEEEPAPSRVEVDWLSPKLQESGDRTGFSRTMGLALMLGVVVLLGAVAGLTWQMMSRQQMERALSDQYAARPRSPLQDGFAMEALPPGMPSALVKTAAVQRPMAPEAAHQPTVDELSRMSDEQLLEILPTLGETEGPRPATFANPHLKPRVLHHPLDGKPLNLRVEQRLTDPLAGDPMPPMPEPAALR